MVHSSNLYYVEPLPPLSHGQHPPFHYYPPRTYEAYYPGPSYPPSLPPSFRTHSPHDYSPYLYESGEQLSPLLPIPPRPRVQRHASRKSSSHPRDRQHEPSFKPSPLPRSPSCEKIGRSLRVAKAY
ncbi:hypothetical protein NGA_0649300 [Nannochloropsis gaditana CCMP526]|uniref:uncharacterized protein n=1 Tax=Nannochloropsis gaditana (strain CCMP526) TaxID=1093141 RepID=UPI00029F6C9C|nr:hypothetical protein NGA_0649300 [Nannochloropsis gaditana CCMP526]EKU20689.1 hypothetical protein NGA_0649300 [Nannochloropsis gaditana CCMP526]|eukprot:XP_005855671.1 hypothetical protein NGA_0649300 [Nannochloropsis gaditana CCMP526]